jgi:hypothetical protein
MNKKIINIRSVAVLLASTLTLAGALTSIAMADNPVPVTTSISPSAVAAGSAGIDLTVNGSNFIPSSMVNVNGSARPTIYVSSAQLTATIPASDLTNAGSFNITVTNPSPGGGTSNAQVFTVGNVVPTTTSISPPSAVLGSAGFTLTVNGTNFLTSSMVNFNGSARSTGYVSSTQLTATINASDLTSPGTFNVTVTNPVPGGGTSNAQPFVVTGNNPVPTLTSISPSSTMVGGGSFVMTLQGANFSPSSSVTFNGITKPTTFVSSNQLTAVIPASDIAATGTDAVMVTNPGPGGGTSNAIIFTIKPTSITPGLPNTGFGPSAQPTGQNTGFIAAIGTALVGIFSIAIMTGKRVWATK